MLSANQSSSLDSNSALLSVTVTWNLLKDIYGYLLEHIFSQQSTFLAGSVRRAMKGCSFRSYRGWGDYWNIHGKEGRNRLCSFKTTLKHCKAKRNDKDLIEYWPTDIPFQSGHICHGCPAQSCFSTATWLLGWVAPLHLCSASGSWICSFTGS